MQKEMLTRRGAISQERPLPFAALSPRSRSVLRRVCVTRVLQFARLRRKREEGELCCLSASAAAAVAAMQACLLVN